MDIRIILSFFLAFFCTQVHATRVINYSEDEFGYIGKYVSIYEDSTNKLDFSQVYKLRNDFKGTFGDVANFGLTKSTYWLKFTITNQSDYKQFVINIENPLLNFACLYTEKNGMVDSVCIDRDQNDKNRLFKHQFYTFLVDLDKGDSITCFLKTGSNTQLLVPISVHHRGVVVNNLLEFDMRSGIFLGIMLSMLVYNLFLYISARDKQYLYYVNYIFWVTAAQAAILGLFYRFFGVGSTGIDYIVPFAGAMSGIASVLFVKSFLGIKAYSKRLIYCLNLIILGDLIAILFLFFDSSLAYMVVNAVAGIGSIFVLYVAFYVKRKGNKNANLFLLAWGIFLGSVIVFVLKDYGYVRYSQLSTYIVQLGVSVEAMLLSFALGNKINTYRKENEESQRREFNALRENERLIKEQNELLEVRIEERTSELKVLNESLEDTLRNLKEAQSQLVESEKMASLGQLTAGVAHEINNPINFVTSNVKPLKRDLEIVWEAFDYMEALCMNESLDYATRKTEIANYKEKADIEYLRSEIDFLMRGMSDGANRTAEIVKSLRIFSRVDEDLIMYADINLGIESTLIIIGSLISEKIELIKNLGDIPQIECYPGKLNQVFLNIFTNAIYAIEKKFDGRAGGILKISSELLKKENNIRITIEDNGIGIPEDIVNKIFDPFFTTKDVGEGTGLGMSIVYNTVMKHNGDIRVESTEGVQTKFVITLPVNQTT